jgi:signal transduction histidine kinase
MVVVRWAGVVFACVQTATYYLPFPAHVELAAWIVNGLFALAAAAITVAWLAAPRVDGVPQTGRRLAALSMCVDAAFALAVTWIYAFDPNTAIFAVLYIVAIEGAFRYGQRGALGTMAVFGIAYAARDVWASRVFDDVDLLPASISFRVGVGFLLAAVAGAMAERSEREHRRLQVALESERQVAAALRSLDELRSTFLAAVSHELRTPLTSILGFSLTMQDRSPELSSSSRMMLDHVVDESRHLEQLLEDLLDIERMGRGSVVLDRHATDVVAIASEAAARIARRSGRDVHVDAPATTANLDPRKVERILDNLLGNAVKYSPDDSVVKLRVIVEDDGVHLVVEDEGPGVPDELRTTIFQPFERGQLTSAHQPGTGIGLSLVDRFARVHGGRAWVCDREDELTGASFHVFLPDGPSGQSIASVADQPWGRSVDGQEAAAS